MSLCGINLRLLPEASLNGKIRPIPYAPVMVNALTGGVNQQLWGTNHIGKLMNLGRLTSIDVLVPEPENSKWPIHNPILCTMARGNQLNSQIMN